MNRIRAVLEGYERIPRWLRFTAVVLWAWVLWWLSSRRGSDLEGIRVGGFITNGAHVAFFGVLAGLVFLAWVGSPSRRLPWSAGIATAYGIVDELHQATVPGRSPSVADVLSDGAGAVFAGCALLWILGRNASARRALPWLAGMALATVCLATWTDL